MDSPEFQRGWSAAIAAVRASLADWPEMGLDQGIAKEVERIVQQACLAEIEAIRRTFLVAEDVRRKDWEGI